MKSKRVAKMVKLVTEFIKESASDPALTTLSDLVFEATCDDFVREDEFDFALLGEDVLTFWDGKFEI